MLSTQLLLEIPLCRLRLGILPFLSWLTSAKKLVFWVSQLPGLKPRVGPIPRLSWRVWPGSVFSLKCKLLC